MNARRIRAIALKDLRAIGGNMQVWLPMVIVPVMLGVLVPGGLLAALLFLAPAAQFGDLETVVRNLPPGPLTEQLAALPGLRERIGWFTVNYLLAPFYLLIPLMAASTVTADSFAGEKERGTLESLLFSPVSLAELFLGKAAAALGAALGLTFGTFVLTMITVNALGWKTFGGPFFPTVNWLPLLLLVIPLLSVAVIFLNVFISARVRTFQAAYQFGGIMVLPVIALFVGQLSGVLLLSPGLIVLIGLALLVIDVLFLLLLLRFLDRPRLFEGQVGS